MEEGATSISRWILRNQSEPDAKVVAIAQLLFIDEGKRTNEQKYVGKTEALERLNEKGDERLASHFEKRLGPADG
jgi:hypothetical protein